MTGKLEKLSIQGQSSLAHLIMSRIELVHVLEHLLIASASLADGVDAPDRDERLEHYRAVEQAARATHRRFS